jgi:glycosyltransferase involved in cell wall biosynthesis
MDKNSKKLVTVLTPCYNAEGYIFRLLDSVLNQTYDNIEMIVIDDGSKDKSKNVVESYIEKFENRGFKLRYIYKDNGGVSSAINYGLKLVEGDYLVWPDSDDWYETNDIISKFVDVLDNSEGKVSMVRCQYLEPEETNLEVVNKFSLNSNTYGKTDFFEDCMFLKNGYWLFPGGYMAKVSKIDELIPNREIYTEKFAAQNWQIQLPLLYKHKLITIEDYAFNYLRRKNSFTRGLYKQMDMYSAFKNTLLNTLKIIKFETEKEKEDYLTRVIQKYDIIFFTLYLEGGRYSEAKSILNNAKNLPKKLWIKYYLKFPFLKSTKK